MWTEWQDERPREIQTAIRATVDEVLFGVWADRSITFYSRGGWIGDSATLYSDMNECFFLGENGIFFLSAARPRSNSRPQWIAGRGSKNNLALDGSVASRLLLRAGGSCAYPRYTLSDLDRVPVGTLQELRDSIEAVLTPGDPRHLWERASLIVHGLVEASERCELNEAGEPVSSPLDPHEARFREPASLRRSYQQLTVRVSSVLKGTHRGIYCFVLVPDYLRPKVTRDSVPRTDWPLSPQHDPVFTRGERYVFLLDPDPTQTDRWRIVKGRFGLFDVFENGMVAEFHVPVDALASTLK